LANVAQVQNDIKRVLAYSTVSQLRRPGVGKKLRWIYPLEAGQRPGGAVIQELDW
jgi:hypothetical protein